jgi:high-affinity nickel permease
MTHRLITVGLDADHISAIDNATRQMVNLGQKPVTVGEQVLSLWSAFGRRN